MADLAGDFGAGGLPRPSSTSPVAILATMMAAAVASPGRFSHLGPFGIGLPPEKEGPDEQ
jgi:hypothetical protein